MGAINGLFQTGGLFGTLSCITTADRFGRRMAMLIVCVFSIVGGRSPSWERQYWNVYCYALRHGRRGR